MSNCIEAPIMTGQPPKETAGYRRPMAPTWNGPARMPGTTKTRNAAPRGVLSGFRLSVAVVTLAVLAACSPSQRLNGEKEAQGAATADSGKTETELRRALKADPDDVASRAALANNLIDQGKCGEADKLAEEGLERSPDDPSLLKVLSRVYVRRGSDENRPEYYQTAERYCRQVIDMGAADADVYARLGWLLLVAEKAEDAVPWFKKALELDSDHAFAMSRLGAAYKKTGKYEKALPFLERSAQLVAEDPGAVQDPFWVLACLADLQALLGDHDAAVATMAKACEMAPPDAPGWLQGQMSMHRDLNSNETGWHEAHAHEQLASRHKDLGRLDRALAEYERALELAPHSHPQGHERLAAWEGHVYWNLSYIASRTDDLEQRLEYAQKAVEALSKTDDLWSLGVVYRHLGSAYYNIGFEAFDKLQKRDDPLQKQMLRKAAEAYTAAERCFRQTGHTKMAREAMEQAAQFRASLHGTDAPELQRIRARLIDDLPPKGDILEPELVDIAMTEVRYRLQENDYPAALTLMRRLVKHYDSVLPEKQGFDDLWFYRALADTIDEVARDVNEEIVYFEKALAVANRVRKKAPTDKFKRGAVSSQFQDACCWLVQLNTEKGDYEKAFYYGEHYKGRALLDLLGSERISAKRQSVRKRQDQQQVVLAKLEDLERQVELARQAGDASQARSLERDLAIEKTRYERLAEDVTVADIEIASFETVDVATWEEVQPLMKGFTLVNYVLTPGSQNTAVIASEDGLVCVPLSFKGRNIREYVEAFRTEMGVKTETGRDLTLDTSDETAPKPEAPAVNGNDRLYELLVTPVLPHIKTHVVYISSYGVVNYIPFEALRNKDGRYLVEDHAIIYIPSASVLKLCLAKERQNRDTVLALGNPNLRNPAFRLIHAENEVAALAGFFPKVDVYTFDQATESVVKECAGDYDILHFACHGELNLDEPMLTSLRLAPDDANDGYFHAGEVFEMSLSASLVVLSACNSAMGELSTGNELTGLTRSFLYAGTPAIIASLWQVDDRSTAFLMGEFYKNLRTMTKAEALRQAKLATMKEYPSPVHWAPFCLQGDYR